MIIHNLISGVASANPLPIELMILACLLAGISVGLAAATAAGFATSARAVGASACDSAFGAATCVAGGVMKGTVGSLMLFRISSRPAPSLNFTQTRAGLTCNPADAI